MVIIGANVVVIMGGGGKVVDEISGGLLVVVAFVSRMSLKTAVVVGLKGLLVVGRLVWDRKGRKALVVVLSVVVVVAVVVIEGGFPTLTTRSLTV